MKICSSHWGSGSQSLLLDSDGDGYGTVAESGRVYSCFNPSASLGLNYVNEEDYGDCDDNDASIHPGFMRVHL